MATIRTRKRADGGRSWNVQIRLVIDGELYTENRTFPDSKFKRRDAEVWARNREKEIEEGARVPEIQHRTVTYEDLIDKYIESFEELAEWGKTKAADLRHLKGYSISERPVLQLKAQDYIEHIQVRLDRGIKPQTANNDLIWFRVIAKIARGAWGVPVSVEPIDAAAEVCRAHNMIDRPVKRTRRPTIEELEALLEYHADRDGRAQIQMVDIILFQIFSARRISETCRITWEDYFPERKIVIVRDMKDPRKKKGNDVQVVLTDQAIKIIERQPRIEDEPRIFPYDSRSVGAAFLRGAKVAGVTGLHLHDLRHEGVSWLFETGLDIPRVSKISGHKSWASLQRYAHLEGVEPFDRYKNWAWLKSSRPAKLSLVK